MRNNTDEKTDLLHFWIMNSGKTKNKRYILFYLLVNDLFKVIFCKPIPALHHLCVLCPFSSAFQSLTDVSADQYRGLWGDEAIYNVLNTFNHLGHNTNHFKYPCVRVNTSLV